MNSKRISQSNLLAKECIVSALLQLIYIKPLSAITISELCQKAGVSRMTFYRNYDSKEEIFTKQLTEICNKYKDDADSLTDHGHFYDVSNIHHYFTYLYNYKDFFDGLVYCGFGIYFLEMINDYVCENWGDMADQYTLYAFSGALYNTFHLWASNGYQEKPIELASRISKIFT
ncbi:MAG: TetR/AcrR family transcriptional regulator [Lachnospiraceae bacterium]